MEDGPAYPVFPTYQAGDNSAPTEPMDDFDVKLPNSLPVAKEPDAHHLILDTMMRLGREVNAQNNQTSVTINQLCQQLAAFEKQAASPAASVTLYKEQLEELSNLHKHQIQDLKSLHDDQTKDLKEHHEIQAADLKSLHRKQMADLTTLLDKQLASFEASHKNLASAGSSLGPAPSGDADQEAGFPVTPEEVVWAQHMEPAEDPNYVLHDGPGTFIPPGTQHRRNPKNLRRRKPKHMC
ncbi:hypothetical protein Hte_000081 [Hypoxylon texense]